MKYLLILAILFITLFGSIGSATVDIDGCCNNEVHKSFSFQDSNSYFKSNNKEDGCCDKIDCDLCHNHNQAMGCLFNSLFVLNKNAQILLSVTEPMPVVISGFLKPPIT